MCVALFGCIWEWTLTCGKGEELSPHSQHGTQQAFVRGKPEDVSVYNLPAVVSLVQIIAAALFLHIVPTGEGKMLRARMLSCTWRAERLQELSTSFTLSWDESCAQRKDNNPDTSHLSIYVFKNKDIVSNLIRPFKWKLGKHDYLQPDRS